MKLKYYKSTYVSPETTYIEAWKDGEPYCDVTVNLASYGILPDEKDVVFIPAYKLNEEELNQVEKDLVDKVLDEVKIGPFKSLCLKVKLKPNWKEMVSEL